MKRALAVFTAVVVLGFGAMAFAHGGGGYGYGGHMGGPGMMGYGGGGYGYGGHMGYGDGEYDKDAKEFLEKTADLRRDLHEKRFEYMEAYRSGDEKKAKKLAKELDELSGKLYAAAPKGGFGPRGGYGRNCW